MTDRRLSRRRYIVTLGGAIVAGSAGCSSSDTDTDTGNDPSSAADGDADSEHSQADPPGAYWPLVNGTPGNTNYVAETDGPWADEKISSFGEFGESFGVGPVESSVEPIIANDTLYLSRGGIVQAIDVRAGQELNEVNTEIDELSGIGYHQQHVLLAGDITLGALDPDLRGGTTWTVDIPSPPLTPPTARESIAVVGTESGMTGFDIDAGELAWFNDVSIDTAPSESGTAHPITLGDNYAFPFRHGTEQNILQAVDLQTGKVVMNLTEMLRGDASLSEFEIRTLPVYRDGLLYVLLGTAQAMAGRSEFVAIDTDSFETNYRTGVPASPDHPMAVTETSAYFVSGHQSEGATGSLYQISLDTGETTAVHQQIPSTESAEKFKTMADGDAIYMCTDRSLGVTDHDGNTLRQPSHRSNDDQWADRARPTGALGFGELLARNKSETDPTTEYHIRHIE